MQNIVILFASRLVFKKLEQAGVEVLRIQDVAKTTSGGTPSRNVPEYFEGNIPWLKSGELNDGFIHDAEEHITEEALRKSSAKLFPKGTLLVALYGATTGKTGILDMEAATNQAVCAVFPKECVERDFLYWYFRMKRHEFLISSYGGAQPNISQKTIKESLIPIPSLEIQKKVVSFLDAISSDSIHLNDIEMVEPLTDIPRKVAKIKNIMVRIEEARRLRNAAAKEAETLLFSVRSQIFDVKDLTELPSLQDVCIDVTDGTHDTPKYVEEGVPFLTGKDISPEGLDFDNVRYITEEDHLRFSQHCPVGRNDVLLTLIGTIDKVALVDTDIEFSVKNVGLLKPNKNKLEPRYLLHFLQSRTFQKQATSHSKKTAQTFLGLKRLRTLKIPMPSLTEQRRIVAYLDSLQEKVDELKKMQDETEKEIEEMIPSILDKAFYERYKQIY